ncbi:MAG: TMEM14 family protein [Cyanobacteria bacterium P01_A01_bin.3]
MTSIPFSSLILVYAAFVAIGGGIGFLKSQSKVSLFSGLGSAALLLVAYIVSRGSSTGGLAIALGCAIALCAVFLMRLKKTGKFMPAGLMGIVSAIAAIVFALGLMG